MQVALKIPTFCFISLSIPSIRQVNLDSLWAVGWEYYVMNAGLNQDNRGHLLHADRSIRQLLYNSGRARKPKIISLILLKY